MPVPFPLPTVQPRNLRLGVLSLSRVVWKQTVSVRRFSSQVRLILNLVLGCFVLLLLFFSAQNGKIHTHSQLQNYKFKWGFCLFLRDKQKSYEVKVSSNVTSH